MTSAVTVRFWPISAFSNDYNRRQADVEGHGLSRSENDFAPSFGDLYSECQTRLEAYNKMMFQLMGDS